MERSGFTGIWIDDLSAQPGLMSMIFSNCMGTLVVVILLPPQGEQPFRPITDRDGTLVLPAERAFIRGERIRLETGSAGAVVKNWTSTRDSVYWDFLSPGSGRYVVVVEYSVPTGQGGATFQAKVADQVRQAKTHSTGKSDRFLPQPLKDAVELPSGCTSLEIRAIDAPAGLVMNLSRIRLVPADMNADGDLP